VAGSGAAYRAAKAGVEGLTRGLRDEFAESNIAVNLMRMPAGADEEAVGRAGLLVAEMAQRGDSGEFELQAGES
jgi:NAD(P)-dependent dehydrogenase (short-subunit alcohol dehydrogenase family)